MGLDHDEQIKSLELFCDKVMSVFANPSGHLKRLVDQLKLRLIGNYLNLDFASTSKSFTIAERAGGLSGKYSA